MLCVYVCVSDSMHYVSLNDLRPYWSLCNIWNSCYWIDLVEACVNVAQHFRVCAAAVWELLTAWSSLIPTKLPLKSRAGWWLAGWLACRLSDWPASSVLDLAGWMWCGKTLSSKGCFLMGILWKAATLWGSFGQKRLQLKSNFEAVHSHRCF